MCTVKFIWLRIFIFLAVVGFLVVRSLYPHTPPAQAAARKAVVVELFTSEGCSSCPPADILLSQLREDKSLSGIEVIPLGFHVDYWNYLGWQDRFSSHAFSQRQEKYAARLSPDGPYTPQMVVDGAEQFVGNDSGRARSAIARAAADSASAAIELTPASADKLLVRVKAPANASGDVLLAVTEDNLANKIGAGENSGRLLRHSAVVRDFRLLGQLHDGAFQSEVSLKIEKDWKRADLRAVVFVQAPDNGKIVGAATLKL
ncbi:MAG: DUF1223 domain-containing protein [Acidobacteriia bacterium]|nr:DUF1223 domain-containing protein [Terriglobia bacterium]